MTLQHLFEQLEGIAFQANMEVFSSFNTFYFALQQADVVQALISQVKSSPESAREVFKRFMHLLRNNAYPSYAHPDDVTLAAYLVALDHGRIELARVAVKQTLNASNLWWARQLALRLQESHLTKQSQFEIVIKELQSKPTTKLGQTAAHGTFNFEHVNYRNTNISSTNKTSLVGKTAFKTLS